MLRSVKCLRFIIFLLISCCFAVIFIIDAVLARLFAKRNIDVGWGQNPSSIIFIIRWLSISKGILRKHLLRIYTT